MNELTYTKKEEEDDQPEGLETGDLETVEDDEELVAISKVFEQMLDDVDLEM